MFGILLLTYIFNITTTNNNNYYYIIIRYHDVIIINIILAYETTNNNNTYYNNKIIFYYFSSFSIQNGLCKHHPHRSKRKSTFGPLPKNRNDHRLIFRRRATWRPREEEFFRKMKEQKDAEGRRGQRQDKLAAMGEEEREQFFAAEADAAVQKKKRKASKGLAKASEEEKIKNRRKSKSGEKAFKKGVGAGFTSTAATTWARKLEESLPGPPLPPSAAPGSSSQPGPPGLSRKSNLPGPPPPAPTA